VGAVAGNVRVLNENQGAIPAMLDVMFTFSFEFIRAGESRVNTVTCCPGALAAYRRSVVDVVKERWLEQTFLGQPANIGEDRALTNLILEQGYLSRYQSNAIVLTEVPNNTRQLSKMLLRWARSNVRETLAMARFAFTKFRKSSALGARIMLMLALWRLALTPFAFGALVIAVVTTPQILPWVVFVTMLMALPQAALYACWRGSARALWAFPYAAYNLVCLSWIAPYAFFTPHHSGWLTRQTPKPATAAPRVIPEPARRMLATADQLRPSRLSLVPDVRLPHVSTFDANS
jgi:hyaluronan synthase